MVNPTLLYALSLSLALGLPGVQAAPGFGGVIGPEKAPTWITSDDRSIPLLTRYLKDADPLVQRSALQDLATRGAKATPAIASIRKLLRHPVGVVRVEAAWALIDLNVQVEAAGKVLVEAAKDKDMVTRVYAARAMGEIVNPPFRLCCWGPGPRPRVARPQLATGFVPLLIELFHDAEMRVSTSAIAAVGQIGPPAKSAVPALLEALSDKNAEVRLEASVALGRVDEGAAAKAGLK